MTTLRVKIDRALCMGSGNCVDVAPEQFDHDGLVQLKSKEVPAEYRNNVDDAIDLCPVQAITILEGEQKPS